MVLGIEKQPDQSRWERFKEILEEQEVESAKIDGKFMKTTDYKLRALPFKSNMFLRFRVSAYTQKGTLEYEEDYWAHGIPSSMALVSEVVDVRNQKVEDLKEYTDNVEWEFDTTTPLEYDFDTGYWGI